MNPILPQTREELIMDIKERMDMCEGAVRKTHDLEELIRDIGPLLPANQPEDFYAGMVCGLGVIAMLMAQLELAGVSDLSGRTMVGLDAMMRLSYKLMINAAIERTGSLGR